MNHTHQICSLIFFPSSSMVLILKSIPETRQCYTAASNDHPTSVNIQQPSNIRQHPTSFSIQQPSRAMSPGRCHSISSAHLPLELMVTSQSLAPCWRTPEQHLVSAVKLLSPPTWGCVSVFSECGLCQQTGCVSVRGVKDVWNETLEPHFLPTAQGKKKKQQTDSSFFTTISCFKGQFAMCSCYPANMADSSNTKNHRTALCCADSESRNRKRNC